MIQSGRDMQSRLVHRIPSTWYSSLNPLLPNTNITLNYGSKSQRS